MGPSQCTIETNPTILGIFKITGYYTFFKNPEHYFNANIIRRPEHLTLVIPTGRVYKQSNGNILVVEVVYANDETTMTGWVSPLNLESIKTQDYE